MNEIIKIYKEAFGEAKEFDERFFKAFGDRVKTLEKDGKTVSVLFLLPCKICGKKIYYLYAAATKADMQNKGFMKELINRVKREADAPIFLKPATESLVHFYEKLGFYPAIGKTKNGDIKITVSKEHMDLSALCEEEKQDFTLMFSFDTKGKSFEFPYTMQ